MAFAQVNGVSLYYELTGAHKVPIVLVHGSWDSHQDWEMVVPILAESFQVLTYDRRGHSQSERPSGPGSIREDVSDLASLIKQLDLAPAWIVGNSFGASIALRLASHHPELFRGLIAHEPPLFALLADDQDLAPMLADAQQKLAIVVERIAAGDDALATEEFVEHIALGPGSWAQIPFDYQQAMIENAPTFLDESRDPEQLTFDLETIKSFTKPTLLTRGDQSPPLFRPVVTKLAAALRHAQVVTLPGAGHIPHVTHPAEYVETILRFVHKASS